MADVRNLHRNLHRGVCRRRWVGVWWQGPEPCGGDDTAVGSGRSHRCLGLDRDVDAHACCRQLGQREVLPHELELGLGLVDLVGLTADRWSIALQHRTPDRKHRSAYDPNPNPMETPRGKETRDGDTEGGNDEIWRVAGRKTHTTTCTHHHMHTPPHVMMRRGECREQRGKCMGGGGGEGRCGLGAVWSNCGPTLGHGALAASVLPAVVWPPGPRLETSAVPAAVARSHPSAPRRG